MRVSVFARILKIFAKNGARRGEKIGHISSTLRSNAQTMQWLEPWTSSMEAEESYRRTFEGQLMCEAGRGHVLYKIPVSLIGRGDGDDVLFEILDGSGRVAEVHLVWQGRQKPPWPSAEIFASIEDWRTERMIPEHLEWINE